MKTWKRVVVYIEPAKARLIKSKLILKDKTLSDYLREAVDKELAK